ncbi:tRNA-dependent cyclodipeptide synthase [Streptomyces sp. RFCAC02]|uniref:tRNA-dependent cyclodipeptide synthase n=1 Tax=Streptomyces sp. RFCAC02 TaxID=2499143 RepID=UPI00101FAD32|nr:tRNA-dependent cyclodipeptide synthase [Streptomyces sp. RFCAC02]
MTASSPAPFVPAFTTEPLTDNCDRILKRGDHALIGVSPGNSYFSESRITGLLTWAAARCRAVHVMIPDSAFTHTLLALGYSPGRARRKTSSEASRIRNRVERAAAAAALRPGTLTVFRLAEIEASAVYRDLLRRAQEAYRDDAATRDSVARVVAPVLRGHLDGASPTADQLDEAAAYLLAETPLLLDTPGLLGVPSSAGIYHRHVAFIDDIYAGKVALSRSERQAFIVTRPAS